MKIKVSFFYVDQNQKETIKKQFQGKTDFELRFTQKWLDEKTALEFSDSDAVAVFIRSKIDRKALRLVKPTAFLVNTSRGKVVDTEAIAEALREDRIGGVALDTFEGEEIWIEEEFLRRDDLATISLKQAIESFFILRSERVILTPHNAFNTKEALKRILITGSQNIIRFFEGKPQNVVRE